MLLILGNIGDISELALVMLPAEQAHSCPRGSQWYKPPASRCGASPSGRMMAGRNFAIASAAFSSTLSMSLPTFCVSVEAQRLKATHADATPPNRSNMLYTFKEYIHKYAKTNI